MQKSRRTHLMTSRQPNELSYRPHLQERSHSEVRGLGTGMWGDTAQLTARESCVLRGFYRRRPWMAASGF